MFRFSKQESLEIVTDAPLSMPQLKMIPQKKMKSPIEIECKAHLQLRRYSLPE